MKAVFFSCHVCAIALPICPSLVNIQTFQKNPPQIGDSRTLCQCSKEKACRCSSLCVIPRVAEIRHERWEFRTLSEIKKNGDRSNGEIRATETFEVIS